MISKDGHEVACHGPDHRLVYELSMDEFRRGLRDDKALLEDLSGTGVEGYRAPNFSITLRNWWAVAALQELSFTYDSSVFPFQRKRYGVPKSPLAPFRHNVRGGSLVELPLTVVKVAGMPIPISGGGYFRLLPRFLLQALVRRLEKEERALIFYLHPWEIDPDQPRPAGIPLRNSLMHYLNLSSTEDKLDSLLRRFHFGPLHDIARLHREATIWSPYEAEHY